MWQHSIGEKLEKKKGADGGWPNYLDEAFKNARGKWDPDRSDILCNSANSICHILHQNFLLFPSEMFLAFCRWHQNRKRGSTPPPSEESRPKRGATAAAPTDERPNSDLSGDGRVRPIN